MGRKWNSRVGRGNPDDDLPAFGDIDTTVSPGTTLEQLAPASLPDSTGASRGFLYWDTGRHITNKRRVRWTELVFGGDDSGYFSENDDDLTSPGSVVTGIANYTSAFITEGRGAGALLLAGYVRPSGVVKPPDIFGKLRELIEPALVADEVEHLVRERGAKLVLFQDDDFLAGGRTARAWAHEVAAEIVRRRLADEMRFKIACRSDEVRPEVMAPLVEAGLCHVYLGVESGDETNLSSLNKLLRPEVHVRAGEILRAIDLSFDFGFMLLEPWSTLETARNNASFLRAFTEDGWAVAGFCRTLPYVGTPTSTCPGVRGIRTGLPRRGSWFKPRTVSCWTSSTTRSISSKAAM